MMTDPTPSPQVRDVDRAIAEEMFDAIYKAEIPEGFLAPFVEQLVSHIARHLAPEREEAERWRDALESLSREVAAARRVAFRARDQRDHMEVGLADDLFAILAKAIRAALELSPEPQALRNPANDKPLPFCLMPEAQVITESIRDRAREARDAVLDGDMDALRALSPAPAPQGESES